MILEPSHGYGIYPMKKLYEHAMRAYIVQGREPDSFKMALRLYYLVEPAIASPELLQNRLTTLDIVTCCLCTMADSHEEFSFPLIQLFLPVRAKLVVDYKKCFSADSKSLGLRRSYSTIL